jgi:hypothetical protein
MPDASLFEFTASDNDVVAERKLMDVFAFRIAASGDEMPAISTNWSPGRLTV